MVEISWFIFVTLQYLRYNIHPLKISHFKIRIFTDLYHFISLIMTFFNESYEYVYIIFLYLISLLHLAKAQHKGYVIDTIVLALYLTKDPWRIFNCQL